jgi:hypothetical protein
VQKTLHFQGFFVAGPCAGAVTKNGEMGHNGRVLVTKRSPGSLTLPWRAARRTMKVQLGRAAGSRSQERESAAGLLTKRHPMSDTSAAFKPPRLIDALLRNITERGIQDDPVPEQYVCPNIAQMADEQVRLNIVDILIKLGLESATFPEVVDYLVKRDHRVGKLGYRVDKYLEEHGMHLHRLLDLLTAELNVATRKAHSESDQFADFPKLPRKLLMALDGKGKVAITAAFRAVHGRKRWDRTARNSFLTLVRRTSDALPTKGYTQTILPEAGTLQLIDLPKRRSSNSL